MMLKGRIGLGLVNAAAALGVMALAGGAFGQGATTAPGKATPPAAGNAAGKAATPPLIAPPAAGAAAQSNWVKVCGEDAVSKKNICQVRYDLKTDQGQLVTQVTIVKVDQLDKPPYVFAVILPNTVFLPPGVTFTIDGKGKPIKLEYQACAQQACYAEGGTDAPTFDAVRKSSKLVMVAKNQQQKEMSFDISMAGFARVFDGPGLDLAAAKAQDDALNQALAQRAEQARQQLIQKQQGAP